VILPACVLLLIVSVPLTGGELARLAEVRLRWSAALVGAIGLQLALTVDSVDPTLGAVLHLLSYACAGAFVVVNRQVPGLLLTASGGAMNLAAIAANGGVMPASPQALRMAGITTTSDHFVNSASVEGARLSWLGDIFAIPASWPLSNVFSMGDIVLLIGAGYLLHRVSRHGVTPRRPPDEPPHATPVWTNAIRPAPVDASRPPSPSASAQLLVASPSPPRS
jgi:hypothetical protein